MAYEFPDTSDHPINDGYGNYKDYDPLRPRGFEDEEENEDIDDSSCLSENKVTVVNNNGNFGITNDEFLD